MALVALFLAVRRVRRAVGQAHAQRFDGRSHGVGGIHPAAGALARARIVQHGAQFFFGDLLGQPLPIRLKRRNDIELAVAQMAGADPAAMIVPGMFLSHPGSATLASYHWARITVSIESAMMSRESSEHFMPSVPI